VRLEAEGTLIRENFSLTVYPGEKVLLFGPSGTGKSSVLKAFLGFFPLSSGEIRLKGGDLSRKDIWTARREIAYVPQNTDLGEGSVEGLIDAVLSYKHNRGRAVKDGLDELTDRFELGRDTLEKDFGNLSGGEKQRIGIIVASLLNRPIYFLDEVTSSLDAGLKRKVIEYFLSLEDRTEVIVSHDSEWAGSSNVRIVPFTEAVPKRESGEEAR
jgi:putative ABC transport system ATP-binding protein